MSESQAPSPASQKAPVAGVQRRAWLPDQHFTRYLVVGLVCVNLFAALGAVWFFGELRRSEEQKVLARASTIIGLITKDIEVQYARIDLSLQVVADESASQLARGRESFEDWIESIAKRHPAVNFMRITDADGEVIYPSADSGRLQANIADRAYFRHLRDDPQAGLEITGPLTGRTTGRTVIVLARRLADRDKSFAGIVLASVPVDHLSSRLGDLLAEPKAEVALLDSRFRWIAEHPAPPEYGEERKRLIVDLLRKAVEGSPERGSFALSIAAVDYLITYARSETFGFYTLLAKSESGELAIWQRKVLAGTAAMALFALLSAAGGWLLNRSWTRQAVATSSVLQRDEWIAQAQKVGGFGFFSYEIASDHFAITESLYDIAGIAAGYLYSFGGWLALVHPDDRDGVNSAFRRAMTSEQNLPDMEYRIIRWVDGSVRWVQTAGQLLVAADGVPRTISGVIMDITVQKKDEDALRRSEQLFRSVFENSMIGMATTSPDKGWLTVNQTLCDIFGYARDELLHITWADLTHPDHLDADVEFFNRVLAGEIDAYEMDKRFIRKDGEVVDAFIAARAIRRPDASIDYFVALVQDITPRKRIEMQLRESEADLSAAVDHAATGIAFVAPDGRWLRVNERLCQLVAYPEAELLALRFQDITHPDDLDTDLAQLEHLLRGEIESYSLEKRYIRRDGRCIWVNLSVSLILHDDGTPNHFVSIIEDIDVRKNAERDARRLRELMNDFLDHLPGLAFIKDQSMRFLQCNRGLQEQLHLDREQILGRSNRELFPGEFGEKIDAFDARVLASGQTEIVELEYGPTVFQTTKFIIPQSDGPALLGGIALDVTRRHLLEERIRALLEINELGRSLREKEFLVHGLETAERLTASTVAFLHFVDDDQEQVQLTTWSAGAQRACSAAFESHYPISHAGIWADCCRQKRAVICNDYPSHAQKRGVPEGHTPLQRLISVPVIEQGMVRMIVGVGNKSAPYDDFDVETVQLLSNDVWSIVRRARAEEALSHRLAEVTQLKDKLEQAHLQLLQSEKMSAIGQLAAGVAHELNNPIGFVYSNLGTLAEYAENLLAIDAAQSSAEQRVSAADSSAFDEVRRLKAEHDHPYIVDDLPKLIRESKEGLERVRKIVLDLKDFSRVGEAEWQWADLEQGLDSTINIVWNELKYKADVERQYTGLPPINCLPSQLNQVFMNLLVNAAQAIDAHGKIVIRTGSDADDDGVVVAVWVEIEDSGRGMSPEVQKRVFEPFFTTKQIGQGTGLGLSISFGIIERHHGRIDLRSQPGRGTIFRITLPIDGSQTSVTPA